MAYSKRIPSMKLILTTKEYNNLIGILTKNFNESKDRTVKELAFLTKEKLLSYSVPKQQNENSIEIELKLYNNEIADIISQLLLYISSEIEEVDYYRVLLKVRENLAN